MSTLGMTDKRNIFHNNSVRHNNKFVFWNDMFGIKQI